MSFAEILDTGFRLMRNHFPLFAGIACAFYVPLGLLTSWLVGRPGALTGGHAGTSIAGGIVVVILALVGGPIVFAGFTFAVGEVYVGRPTSVGQSMRAVLPMMVPYAGTALVYGLALLSVLPLPVLGALLFRLGIPLLGAALILVALAYGVYLFLSFLLVWQVVVLERVYGFAALKRSRRLMKGNLLRGAGVTLVGAVVVGVLSGVLQLALGYIPVLGPIGSAAAKGVGMAYTTAVAVVLYFDIRSRSEAFDLEHLARLVGAHDAAAAVAAG